MANKRAVIVGINAYPSAPLRGCVNDAVMARNLLMEHFGFVESDIKMLTDYDATTYNILQALKWLTSGSMPGDTLYFHYSGHGAQVLANNTEEANGYDEILCPVDLNWRDRMIRDNDLRAIFDTVPHGVNLTVVLDCCHSGTAMDHNFQYQPLGAARALTRREMTGMLEEDNGSEYAASRMLPAPSELEVPEEMIQQHTAQKRTMILEREAHNYAGLLVTGCQAHQTSADAYINGQYCGAATTAYMDAMTRNNYRITYRKMVEEMNDFMVNRRFTQRPELDYGVTDYPDKMILRFEDVVDTPIVDTTTTTTTTTTTSDGGKPTKPNKPGKNRFPRSLTENKSTLYTIAILAVFAAFGWFMLS